MGIQKHFVRLITLLVLCTGFLLPTGNALAADLPSGWKPYTIGELQVGLPGNWQTLPLGKTELQTLTKQVAKNNPDFAKLLQQLIDSGQYKLLKFFAIDLAKSQNVNALITSTGVHLTPKQIVPVIEQQLKKSLNNLTIVSTDDSITLNDLPAGRIEYTLTLNGETGKSQELTSVQYYLPIGTDIYVFTITGSSQKGFIALADQIASTIQTAKPATGPTTTVRNGGNLRETPTTKGKVLDQIKAKETVTLLGRNAAGTWVRITNARGVTGWASVTLLNSTAATIKKLSVVP
jgi:hypothetical protein